MMSSPLTLVYCQCALLLASFEGIVCPFLDFIIKNFSVADIYNEVVFEGPLKTGQFILKKNGTAEGYRQLVVPLSEILRYSMNQEGNNPKVVSFYIKGASNIDANYNIGFTSEGQAHHFVMFKAIPPIYEISWARIYSNWRPVIMSYERLDNDDIGFKLLDNGKYPDPNVRLLLHPYVFKRSEIEDAITTTSLQIMYLRNKTRAEDYEIMFKSTKNLITFVQLFPNAVYDHRKTADYYSIPRPK